MKQGHDIINLRVIALEELFFGEWKATLGALSLEEILVRVEEPSLERCDSVDSVLHFGFSEERAHFCKLFLLFYKFVAKAFHPYFLVDFRVIDLHEFHN